MKKNQNQIMVSRIHVMKASDNDSYAEQVVR